MTAQKKARAGGKKKRKTATRKPAALKSFADVRAEALTDIGEPVGACFFVDDNGQNQCKLMTQSECSQQTRSQFFPNKQCPGGL